MADSPPIATRLARTSLYMGALGWLFYLLQWCFDLSFGLLLATVTGGTSAFCATILDVFPFAMWIVGIVTGHVALAHIRRTPVPGRRRALWGLGLSYAGILFTLLVLLAILALLALGIGVGFLGRLLPSFTKH